MQLLHTDHWSHTCETVKQSKSILIWSWILSYVSIEFMLKRFFIYNWLAHYQLILITEKSQKNNNLDNGLWDALWRELLQQQQELQLSPDVLRNLKRRVNKCSWAGLGVRPCYILASCPQGVLVHQGPDLWNSDSVFKLFSKNRLILRNITCSSVHFSKTWSQNQASLCGLPTDSHLQNKNTVTKLLTRISGFCFLFCFLQTD